MVLDRLILLGLLEELLEELFEALVEEFLLAVSSGEHCRAFDAAEELLGLRFPSRSASVVRLRMGGTTTTAREASSPAQTPAAVSGDVGETGEVAGGAAAAGGRWGGEAGATLSGRLGGAEVVLANG